MTGQWLYLLARAQTEQGGITYIDVGNAGPKHDIVWVILSTFVLIGIAFLVTLGLGAGMGFMRIWLFQKFPGNKINGSQHEAVTRLHLNDHTHEDSST